jgi:hypothetical protein
VAGDAGHFHDVEALFEQTGATHISEQT